MEKTYHCVIGRNEENNRERIYYIEIVLMRSEMKGKDKEELGTLRVVSNNGI